MEARLILTTAVMKLFTRRERLHTLLQVGEIILTSMGNRTIALVISLFSPTQLPDASESRS